MRRRPGTALDVDRMAELYRGGLTQPEVAAEMGVHPSTVRTLLRTAGVQTRRPGPRSKISDDNILQMLTDGQTVQDVAAAVGMTPGGIYARIRRHQPSQDIYQRVPRQPGARKFDRSKAIEARRRAADERFPPTVRQRLLDALATGALLRDVLKIVPVTSTTLWERTRWDPVWAEQLTSILDEQRPVGWSHGHAQTFYRGCRCTECRKTKAYRRLSNG